MSDTQPDAIGTVEWYRKYLQSIEFTIQERATSDGHYAIAHALMRLVDKLDDINITLEGISGALETTNDR